MSKKKIAIENATRSDLLRVDPLQLTLVTDPKHPLYDRRVELPVDETLVASIMAHGYKSNKPVLVRKNGPLLEVVDGRRRTKAAIDANQQRKAAGLDMIRVAVVLERGDDSGAFESLVISNAMNREDDLVELAHKAKHLLDIGRTEAQIAIVFGTSEPTIRNWLKLLDCAPEVQRAVQAGTVAATVAAKKFAQLTREDQVKALAEVKEAVTPKHAAARHGARDANPRPGLTRPLLKQALELDDFNAREIILVRAILGQATHGELAQHFPKLAKLVKS